METGKDQNGIRAQEWPELATKRLNAVAAQAKVDPKQRELFESLVKVIRAGVSDLYSDASDPKYIYIVNMIMQRIRGALSDALGQTQSQNVQSKSGTQTTEQSSSDKPLTAEMVEYLLSELELSITEQNAEMQESLSEQFFDVITNAFSDLTVRINADDTSNIVLAVREYIKDGVDTILNPKEGFLNFIKTDREHARKRQEQRERAHAKQDSMFQKSMDRINTSVGRLRHRQEEVEKKTSTKFKATYNLIQSETQALNGTINEGIGGLHGRLGSLSTAISRLNPSGIVSGVSGFVGKKLGFLTNSISFLFGGFKKMFSFAFDGVSAVVSKMWDGICGLTKWAAGGIFTAIGKFIRSPIGLAGVAFLLGYVWARWLKPMWDNFWEKHLKPIADPIKKWLNGKKSFGEALSDSLKVLIYGEEGAEKRKNKGIVRCLIDSLMSVELIRFDNSVLACATNALNKIQEKAGIEVPSTSGSFTIGTAITAVLAWQAANFAATILGSPVLMTAVGIGAAIAGIKTILDKIVKFFHIDAEVSLPTAAQAAGSALNGVAKVGREAGRLAKAGQNVIKTGEAVSNAKKGLDAAKTAADAAKAAGDSTKNIAKTGKGLANAGKNLANATGKHTKAVELFAGLQEKLGAKPGVYQKFIKWLGNSPKVMKALKALGPLGILTTGFTSMLQFYEAFNQFEDKQPELARITMAQAINGLISLIPGGGILATGINAILDQYAGAQKALYQQKEATDNAIAMSNKLAEIKDQKSQERIAAMSDDDVLKMKLQNFLKVKAEVDKLVKIEEASQKIMDEEANAWIFSNTSKSMAAQSDLFDANNKKKSLLRQYGFMQGHQNELAEFEQKYAVQLAQMKEQLQHPAPTAIDINAGKLMQQKIDEMREEAAATEDARDDELVEKIQEGFNNGNAEVMQMLKTILMNQKSNEGRSINVFNPGRQSNPAAMESNLQYAVRTFGG